MCNSALGLQMHLRLNYLSIYSGLGKTKMLLFKSHEHAIEAGHRPMFGAGHDLHIIVAIIFIGNKAGRLRLI